jgi:thioredoxin-related protein
MRALICSILILLAIPAAAENEPAWFKESFLDMREDIAEAAKAGRRLMLYFHQDGCPYCAKLLRENFGDKAIADKTRKHFDVIALNLWGDREVTDLAGKTTTEKAFAKALRVQFTPTLIMFDEKGGTALRLNGYIPPHQFHAALDYAGGRLEKRQSLHRLPAGECARAGERHAARRALAAARTARSGEARRASRRW